MKTLYTKRLILRPQQQNDSYILYNKLFNDPEVTRYLFTGGSLNQSETEKFVQKEFLPESQPYGLSTLCEKNTGEIVGFSGIITCEYFGKDDFEFGVALAKSAWGKGYAFEISKEEMKYAFKVLKLNQLFALTHPENVVAQHLIKKCGLSFVKSIKTNDRGPRKVYCINKNEQLKFNNTN